MKTFYINQIAYLELSVLDVNGDFISGLTVTYEIRKSSDNSLFASGTMSEISSVYTISAMFIIIGEYRVKYITPIGYEDGFENIYIDNYNNFKSDIGGDVINKG